MHALYLISVWLHITAAMVWIGGMVFLALILVPALRKPEYQAVAPALVYVTGIRFRWVGWSCLALLVLTGLFNLAERGVGWADLWSSGFGQRLGFKLVVVGLILLLSVLHDFFIGPKAGLLLRQAPGSPAAQRLRRQASWIGRLNLILGLVATALGVTLVRG